MQNEPSAVEPLALMRQLITSTCASGVPHNQSDSLTPGQPLPGGGAPALRLPPASVTDRDGRSLQRVIAMRRSRMVASEAPLGLNCFAALLAGVVQSLPAELLPAPDLAPILCPVVFNVEGLPPAAYRYDPAQHALFAIQPVDRADVRDNMILQWDHGCGTAVLCAVSPLARWLTRYGDRGYRGACMQVGWMIDQLYLRAETLLLHYSASGAFAPMLADNLLQLDGYHYTSLLSFVVGCKREDV